MLRQFSKKPMVFVVVLMVIIGSYFFPSVFSKKDVESIIRELTHEVTPSPTLKPSNRTVLPMGLYQVVRVADGDTLTVLMDTEPVTVRLIGVNTPETVDPRRPVECFGKEASAFVTKLLEGKLVSLQTDPSQSRYDRYGRLLAYVFLEDGTHLNLRLIEEGYGYEYTYDTPYHYQKMFQAAQIKAQNEGKGLWSEDSCGGK